MKRLGKFGISVFVSILIYSCESEEKALLVKDFNFDSYIGFSKVIDSSNVYCLLGQGFFKAPRATDSDRLIKKWVKAHPNAIVVPASKVGPIDMNNRNSIINYCWLIDKDDNLNIYLVKVGCFAGGTMRIPDEAERVVDERSYKIFIEKLEEAEKYAMRNKLGIWGE